MCQWRRPRLVEECRKAQGTAFHARLCEAKKRDDSTTSEIGYEVTELTGALTQSLICNMIGITVE